MVFPNGVATVSRVFKIRDGVITDEILLDVLGWSPAEKRIPLYNTKHRGGAIEHDGFLLTLDARAPGSFSRKRSGDGLLRRSSLIAEAWQLSRDESPSGL
jgi:hypothetical protein